MGEGTGTRPSREGSEEMDEEGERDDEEEKS